RLAVQLSACGKRPMTISLDDYFVERSKTPLDEKGEYDYEHINAIDIPLLNKQLNQFLSGKFVELPKFNFLTGVSEKSGVKLQMEEGTLLILEGIHALNPMLTAQIPNDYKFKIYASALTTILLDDHNYIPTADNRLLRRIIRDFKYRGYSAEETIKRWPSVRAGEEKWIFPFQEEADVMMNTALLFEFAALRNQALPLLEQVPENVPEFSEAYRLRKFLSYLKPISIKNLPPTSLLREFLGGSVFRY
ncbi:MAG: nucleoside kinase, partial [Alloprevotella tannerae]|nr:nucleoside kinase [Alloprevotella tannerae]